MAVIQETRLPLFYFRSSKFRCFTTTSDVVPFGMRLSYLILALAILAGQWSLDSAAWARQWKPSALESARDYLKIEHKISATEGVSIFWIAPEFFDNTHVNNVIREMTQEYMLVATIHYSISNLGVWTFENPAEITVELENSKSLTPLPQEDLPPLVTTVTDFLKKSLASGLGKMGEGMKFFVFDGTQFDRCAEGLLWINYLRERYKFQTPLPGCE